ncbi:MAG TPA: sigma-70 family RNA polymerase sigma factor, partial [Polyangiaceae bacterium]|nr:sigma-70 family RNA polymerase sigma factor [Polyangiaceae bacterium]
MTLNAEATDCDPAGVSMSIGGPTSDPPPELVSIVLSAGRERWPGLKIDAPELASYLADRPVSRERLTTGLACDLFLAFACLANVPTAVQLFQTLYDPIVVGAAKRFDPTGALADELRQWLAETLFVRGRQGTGRIAEYRGQGPLSAWVRTCSKRAALRLAKVNNPEVLVTRDALADEITDVCDQELTLLKDHYGELFRSELVLALGELPAKDRMLLQLHLVAGLSTTRIAKMYHLNQSSISRQLQRTAAATFTLIKQRIHRRLGVDTAELESLLDLARSHIELTLSSMDELLQDVPSRD